MHKKRAGYAKKIIKVLNDDETSLSGSVFHMLVACGTNELWKAFVQPKG